MYIVNEEDAVDLLSEVNLEQLTRKQYMEFILNAFLIDVFELRKLDGFDQATEELFSLILEDNPYVSPVGLEQVEVLQRHARPRKLKTTGVADYIALYQRMKDVLKTSVIGQDAAVSTTLKHISRGLIRGKDETRPIACLMYAGYSGVGKTHLARTLGRALDHPKAFIQVDCAEYGEGHQAARLLGAPAGYVGFEESSYLESRLDPNVIQVLLFDEFEKAHRKIWNLLLAALEEGCITTSKHDTLSLRNCIIILTSNLGTRELAGQNPGFLVGEVKANAEYRIRKELPVELVNRLSDILVFRPLELQDKRRIAELELTQLRERLGNFLIMGEWSHELVDRIAELPGGGRGIRTHVDGIHAEIAQKILEGELDIGQRYTVGT